MSTTEILSLASKLQAKRTDNQGLYQEQSVEGLDEADILCNSGISFVGEMIAVDDNISDEPSIINVLNTQAIQGVTNDSTQKEKDRWHLQESATDESFSAIANTPFYTYYCGTSKKGQYELMVEENALDGTITAIPLVNIGELSLGRPNL